MSYNLCQSDHHQPVMLQEVLHYLDIDPSGTYVDATFGRGGHSQAILQALGKAGKLIAIDKDPTAVHYALNSIHDPRFTVVHAPFSSVIDVVSGLGVLGQVNGLLADFGVSSPQLDNPERGFSFSCSGPLDMRMDPSASTMSAAEWIANVDESILASVIKEYGEERHAKRIARAIVMARRKAPIQTTGELAEIVKMAHPAWQKHKHPATRVFQAIRIFINQELLEIQILLDNVLSILAKGGRLCAISFHSLEDSLLKAFIRQHTEDLLPKFVPITQEQFVKSIKIIKKRVRPADTEIARNPRARSATLRVVEKI